MIGLVVGVDALWWFDGATLRSLPTGLARYGDVVVAEESADPVDLLGGVDDAVSLAGHEVPTSDAIGVLIERAVRAGDLGGPVADTLALVHPPHWGAVRCAVLTAAARPHARDVTVVDSAAVAARAANRIEACPHDGGCRTAVLDRTPGRLTLSTVSSVAAGPVLADCALLVPSTVAGGVDEIDLEAVVARALRDVTATLPICRVVAHGPAGALTAEVLSGLASVPVLEVDDGSLATAVENPCSGGYPGLSEPAARVVGDEPNGPAPGPYDALDSGVWDSWGDTDGATPRRGAWLADRVASTPPASGRRRRAVGAAAALLTAAAAAVALVVVWPVGTTSGAERSAASARSSVPVAPQPTESSSPSPLLLPPSPPPLPTTAPTATPFRVGALGLSVPTGWHLEPGPGRAELRPDDGTPMRILVVVRDIDSGLGLDEIEAELRTAAEGSRRVAGLRRTEGNGRQQLEYLESPSDGTTVGWTVFAARGEQISVGCQGGPDSYPVLSPVCAELLTGLSVQ